MFEAGAFAGRVGIEAEALAGRKGGDGQDVPDVEGNDVGDEDVNVVGGVDALAFAVDGVDGLDIVSAGYIAGFSKCGGSTPGTPLS